MKVVNINDLVKRIQGGTTRDELKAEYGMNNADFEAFKQHPKIKGLRVGAVASINFVDEDVVVDISSHPSSNSVHFDVPTAPPVDYAAVAEAAIIPEEVVVPVATETVAEQQ